MLRSQLYNWHVPCVVLLLKLVGESGPKCDAAVALLTGTVGELRDIWEGTSFAIERLQAAEACVDEEQAGLASRVAPSWHLSFTPTPTPPEKLAAADKVNVHHTSQTAADAHGCCLEGKLTISASLPGASRFWPRLQVRVAIIREEGSNGDREMSSAVYSAGMEPWDITMSDLLHGRATLDTFQGEHCIMMLRWLVDIA